MFADPARCGSTSGVLWTELPVHVIDFEGSRETGVVEFGVVSLAHGAITGVASRVCRARRPVRADDTRVHGLTQVDLAGAEPFEAEWEFFAACRAGGVLAAHFSGTENSLLRGTWPCARLSPDFLDPGRETSEWGPWIDTGRLATDALGRGASAALEDVVAALGLGDALQAAAERWCAPQRRRFHCAGYDALATALVLLRLARDGDAPWSLARVLAESVADRERRDDVRQGRLF